MLSVEIKTSKRESVKDPLWATDEMSQKVHHFFDSLFEHTENGYRGIDHFDLCEGASRSFSINIVLSDVKVGSLISNVDIVPKGLIQLPPMGYKYSFNPENELLQKLNLEGEMITINGGDANSVRAYMFFNLKTA
jgi:hypothetical protein